jgi:hypothetical protein
MKQLCRKIQVGIMLQELLTPVLERDECLTSRPCRLSPGNSPIFMEHEAFWVHVNWIQN